jgi:hypothetical protein
MPQSTRRWIEEKVKSFRESEVLPFHEGFNWCQFIFPGVDGRV